MAQAPLVDGECKIRGELSGQEVVITTTNRLAGAIHSVTWGGKEFIDSFDHGRQLQSASNFDVGTRFISETFNPTEAGSRSNGTGVQSTSRLLHFATGDGWLQSTSQMAFWLEPGQRSHRHPAKNLLPLSNHLLTKRVEIGTREFPNVIRYEVTFSVPLGEEHHYAQFEVLTGYMPHEFRKFYALTDAGELEDLDDGPGEQSQPVILATRDRRFAMGALTSTIASNLPHGPGWSGPGYGRFAFDPQRVTKWNVVFRLKDEVRIPATDYNFEVLVAIGSLEDVRKTLFELSQKLGR